MVVVEIASQDSLAWVAHTRVLFAAAEQHLDVRAPGREAHFHLVPLQKRGAMEIVCSSPMYCGGSTRPLTRGTPTPGRIQCRDWGYFVTRSDHLVYAVYFKLYREGKCPRDSAQVIKEWKKLGHYPRLLTGRPETPNYPYLDSSRKGLRGDRDGAGY